MYLYLSDYSSYVSVTYSFVKRWIRNQQWKWIQYILKCPLVSPFPLIEEDHKKIIFHYLYLDQKFSIQIRKSRGPKPLTVILVEDDKSGNDVTSCLLPYMGTGYNFHHLRYTPSDLGYNTLLFHTMNRQGEIQTHTFSMNEVIDLQGIHT